MPPEENTTKNIQNLNPFKVGIDPIFKGSSSLQNNTTKTTSPTGVGSAYSVLNNQKFVPTQGSATTLPNISNSNPNTPKSLIRTYKSDMESAIQTDHLTSINIAIAENQKMQKQIREDQTQTVETEAENSPSNYSTNKIIIFISFILILAGIAGVAFVYLKNSTGTGGSAQIQKVPSLITVEYEDILDTSLLGKTKLASALSIKLNDSPIPVSNLYNAYITVGTSTTRRLITAPEIVSLLEFKMPDTIKRNLLPDFMIGAYSFDKNLPFIIFKTSSFENTFAGMLVWENNLEKDMRTLFKLPGYDKPGGLLTELEVVDIKKFGDGVIMNKDVRILRDDNNQIILLYSIIDKGTIVITVNDTAFKEILNRLNKEKTLKR